MTSGLSFRLFRIPFRASLWFFVILVFNAVDWFDGFTEAPLFATTMFFLSMLATATVYIVHELGRCLAYRHYGQEPQVFLWGIGGITSGQVRLVPKQRILMVLSGLGITVALYVAARFASNALPFDGPTLASVPAAFAGAMSTFAFWWALINVLPILPLDGGMIVESVLEWRHGEQRKQTARLVSWIAALVAAAFALLVLGSGNLMLGALILAAFNGIPWYQQHNNLPQTFPPLPDEDNVGSMGGGGGGGQQNVMSMDKARKKRDRRSPSELVKAGYEALERREYKQALRITDRLQTKRLNGELDRWAAEVAAFAWVGDRNPVKAEEVLDALPNSARVSRPLVAVMAIADRRTDEGVKLMVDCMVNEPDGGAKLIAIDLFAEYGMIHRLARDLVDQPGGSGFEAAVALESMLHRLHRTQDATTVSDVIMLG